VVGREEKRTGVYMREKNEEALEREPRGSVHSVCFVWQLELKA